LLFDYLPVSAETTIQLRDPKPTEEGGDKPAPQEGGPASSNQ